MRSCRGCEDITVIGRLMAEHEAIRNAADDLRRVAATGGPGEITARVDVLAAAQIDRLCGVDAHIEREDNGVFPAAATALDGPAWDRITDRLAEPAPVADDRPASPRPERHP